MQTMSRPRTMENQQVSLRTTMQPRPQSPERATATTRFRMVRQPDGSEVAVAI